MSLTKRGRRWELLSSLWLIVAALPTVHGFAWIWVGLTARRKQWTIMGVAYIVLQHVAQYLYGKQYTLKGLFPILNNTRPGLMLDIVLLTVTVMPIISFIQALCLRKKYLIFRDIEIDRTPGRREELRQKVLSDYETAYQNARYEDRGKGWAHKNTLWMIPAFIPFANCMAFFYISISARRKKWNLYGFLHMIISFGAYFLYTNSYYFLGSALYYSHGVFLQDLLLAVIFLDTLVGAIQAVCVRREHLIRRDVVVKMKPAMQEQQRQRIVEQYHGKPKQTGRSVGPDKSRAVDLPDYLTGGPAPGKAVPKAAPEPVPVSAPKAGVLSAPTPRPGAIEAPPPVAVKPAPAPTAAPSDTAAPKIDLNHCTERQLASLPGVGVVLAKKAVALRREKGGFSSARDFALALGLRPHFAEQIEKMSAVTPMQTAKGGGRIIDI